MIKSFAHKGLNRLYEMDDHRGVRADHADKLRRMLARLDAAMTVSDMDLPGYRLHALKGSYAGFHAVAVNGNWRVIFRFAEGHAFDVEYLDYH
jgi:toxin HigB-1